MDRDVLRRYEAQVPRYTSYPTAPHFHAGVDAVAYRRWLGQIGGGEGISLYLHVPFCKRMCWYCGCHTKVVRQYDPVADYAALLLREIDLVGEAMIGEVYCGWHGCIYCGTGPFMYSAPSNR